MGDDETKDPHEVTAACVIQCFSRRRRPAPLNEESFKLKRAVYLNMAACHLELDEPTAAAIAATQALGCDENDPKALFRRGRAFLAMGESLFARDDLALAATLE